jgi:hypothetical protein
MTTMPKTSKNTTLKALAAAAMLLAGSALVQTAEAQAPAAPPAPPMIAPPMIDWPAIQITTVDLGNNTYMLQGQGGNITVAVGSDAILMVDGQFAPLSDKIKAAIGAVSPLPVKYLVNTWSTRTITATTPAGTTTSPRTGPSSWRMTTSACVWPPAPRTC